MLQRINAKAFIFFIVLPLLLAGALFFANTVGAHGDEEHAAKNNSAEYSEALVNSIHENSINFAIAGGVLLVFLAMTSLLVRRPKEKFKKTVFVLMVIAIVTPTLYFIVTTLYLNFISDTKGPVHWHADFRIFACGEELVLRGPDTRLSNKVGTPTFHHHDDQRIHVEGVVLDTRNFELADFFEIVGGHLTENSFTLPTPDGERSFTNGDSCPDGRKGVWQVFVYQTSKHDPTVARQIKLNQYTEYLPAPEVTVPPGDCMILEFDEPREKTKRLCHFYQIEKEKGNMTIY